MTKKYALLDEDDIYQNPDAVNIVKTNDGAFINSKAIFVEYNDVIKCPFFVMLNQMKADSNFNTLFDLDGIKNMNIVELNYWYNNRKHQNIFRCFELRDKVFDNYFNGSIAEYDEFIEDLPENELKTFPDFISYPSYLNFAEILRTAIETKAVSTVYIYNEFYNETLERDIKESYPSARFVYGNLKEVLNNKDISKDTTYVFSDIEKIKYLEETKRLTNVSVLLAEKFGYNYNKDNKYKVDVNEIYSDYLFRMDGFDNITTEVSDEELEENEGLQNIVTSSGVIEMV